ncbi:SpoIIE family protein phosphatase [Streptomyces sp. NRRL B-24484]|uniref:SpoIIE family protein phosphatase n=1 Tax=Streptomyces sp. NRRL B-24484 TaxID=1463833 RepID=UPI0004BF9D2A|nr:SpoIIE family protein phosphatase [Streptomyces sp. NRRL B-24484]
MSATAETPPVPRRPSVEALVEALAVTVRRADASVGGLFLLAPDEPVLRLAVMYGVPLDFVAPWLRLPLSGPTPITDATREQRLVWIGSQEDMVRRYPRVAAALPYRFSLAAAPVVGEHRTWGALQLLWPADHAAHATRRDCDNAAAGARRAARLLDAAGGPPELPDQPWIVPDELVRPRAEQDGQAAADYAERLPEGALALDLEGRITFLTATAAGLLGLPAEELIGALPWSVLPWLDDPALEERYRTAVISREPTAFTALRPPDRPLEFQLFPDPGGISVRITPSTRTAPPATTGAGEESGAAPGGVLAERPAGEPGAAFSPSIGRLQQLMHLAAALTEAVGVRDVVDMVADQILPAFGAQALLLSAADAGRLRIIGHRGYSAEAVERLDGLPLDTALSPAGRALTDGIPSFFASPAEIARSYPDAPRISGKQAWAVLPLIVSGRPVGVCVVSYTRPHAFTADERAVLTSLAGLIAQALDRARLYDAKNDLAHGLQAALLPRTLPRLDGLDFAARYLPASLGQDIGGDFYDLIRLDERTAAAVIGDVQGHNVAAAALMGQVRTAVHAHAAAGAAPDQVLARTNHLLIDLEPDLLVSCLYVHLDLRRRQATLASAGHPPPLLRRPGGRAHLLDLEPGPLLGIEVAAGYPLTTLPLPDGTLLALYTDGLVEVPGTDLELITDGLAAHLSDHRSDGLDDLIDGLVRVGWPSGQHTDDIALLLLRATRPAH